MTGSNDFTINYHMLKIVKQQFYFGNILYKTDENNPKL